MQERQARESALSGASTADFELLIGPWVNEMYRLAAAIVGVDGAEDVVQDSLVDAWRGLHRLRDRGSARSWLHAIVVNRASKHLRSARSRPRTIRVETFDDQPGGQAEDPSTAIADRDRLNRAFETLSAEQRACVVLHYGFDQSVPQIAEALEIAEGTVKSRIHAGVQRLRTTISRDSE
jgi:RNA polymerase sigma-70 factor (ECF subfamily)